MSVRWRVLHLYRTRLGHELAELVADGLEDELTARYEATAYMAPYHTDGRGHRLVGLRAELVKGTGNDLDILEAVEATVINCREVQWPDAEPVTDLGQGTLVFGA